jgi:hypothetical protein
MGVDSIKHLSGLTGRAREDAERYIRFTPEQIDTPYRRRIEAELHWTAKTAVPMKQQTCG